MAENNNNRVQEKSCVGGICGWVTTKFLGKKAKRYEINNNNTRNNNNTGFNNTGFSYQPTKKGPRGRASSPNRTRKGVTNSQNTNVSQETINEMIQGARPIPRNTSNDNRKMYNACIELLRKYNITSMPTFLDYKTRYRYHKTEEEMKNIETCANWVYGNTGPIQQNIQNKEADYQRMMVSGLSRMYHDRKGKEEEAERERRLKAARRLGFGPVYGGKRKNKTRRSKKTKRQTRRR